MSRMKSLGGGVAVPLSVSIMGGPPCENRLREAIAQFPQGTGTVRRPECFFGLSRQSGAAKVGGLAVPSDHRPPRRRRFLRVVRAGARSFAARQEMCCRRRRTRDHFLGELRGPGVRRLHAYADQDGAEGLPLSDSDRHL